MTLPWYFCYAILQNNYSPYLLLCLSINLGLHRLLYSENWIKQQVRYLLNNQNPYLCFLPGPSFLPQQMGQVSVCSQAAICVSVLLLRNLLYGHYHSQLLFPSPLIFSQTVNNFPIVESSCHFSVFISLGVSATFDTVTPSFLKVVYFSWRQCVCWFSYNLSVSPLQGSKFWSISGFNLGFSSLLNTLSF